MASLHKSCATLRIHGDSLDPEEVSQILGCSPTKAYKKGYVQFQKRPYKTGGWLLTVADREPGDFDAQVSELFNRVAKDLAVWSALSKEFEIDFFCSFFMEETDEGFEISAQTMQMLAERGIKLGVCLYAPTREIQLTDPCPCTSGKPYGECCSPKT